MTSPLYSTLAIAALGYSGPTPAIFDLAVRHFEHNENL